MITVDPIAQTLALYADFYKEYRRESARNTTTYKVNLNSDRPILVDKFVAVMSYALDQFSGNVVTVEDLRTINKLEHEELTREDLENISLGSIPVRLFKSIANFKDLHVLVNEPGVNEVWLRFVNRYNSVIPK